MPNKLDYIIVGQGVAGSCFALKLLQENKSFLVIDDNKHKASSIAAGIYNPVVLKRFAIVWNAAYQINLLHVYFKHFEELLGKKYIFEMPVFRIFNDENEKKTWLKKADREDLSTFLSKDFTKLNNYLINQPLGSGEVNNTGRIDLTNLLADFNKYLLKRNNLLLETFDSNNLKIESDGVTYNNIKASKIIFAEGFNIKQNPWFNWLPIIGVKGEVIRVKSNAIVPNAVIKAKEFFMPLGSEEFFVGATYNRDEVDYEITKQAEEDLINGVNQFINGDIEVVDHKASIRPTVVDRRPILGRHPIHKNLICLNGMGTRGTMLAPAMTEELFENLENNKPIIGEASIERFYTKYLNEK